MQHQTYPVSRIGRLDNRLRLWLHPPERLFSEWARPGARCADIGCGGGFVSVGLARLVGPSGQVTAIDLQPGMLERTGARALLEGVRVETRACTRESLVLPPELDLAVLFYVAHELSDWAVAVQQLHAALKVGGHLWLAEPPLIVGRTAWQETVETALAQGFECVARPELTFARAAVLRRLP